MKKLLIFLIIIIICEGIYLYFNKFSNYFIKIDGHRFKIETVASLKEREQGLSGRKSLCQNCAMLFLFEKKDKHSFWMKEMNFDLDIIWISGNEIVYIAKNVSHEEGANSFISPDVKADKVLEINSGLCDKLGIKVGDEITL